MKAVLIASAFIIFLSSAAQVEPEKSGRYVRVFDLEGKKIGKGRILAITERSLELKARKENGPTVIKLDDMGYIQTRRSGGHKILMGTAIGAGTFAVIGAASADPDDWLFGYSAGEGATGGAVLGGIAGAAIGGITALLKKSVRYYIQGDPILWQSFKEVITGLDKVADYSSLDWVY